MISGPSMYMPLLSEQIAVFFRSILMGVIFGTIYDVFRISRVIVGVRYRGKYGRKIVCKDSPCSLVLSGISRESLGIIRTVTVVIGDILFFVICGILASIFVYRYCSGIIRFYVLIGYVLGFVAYYNSIGRFVIYLSDILVFFIVSVSKRVFCVILFPFIFLAGRISKIVKDKRKKTHNEFE